MSEGTDPRPDVYRQAYDRPAAALHLPGVQVGPDLDADLPDRLPDGARAPDGAGGPVERGEEAVPGRVDLDAAPMACARVPVSLLVLVNAMIPRPGETPGEWWGNTGWEPARIAAAQAGGYPAEFDLPTYFLHDVPADVAAAREAHNFPETDIAFGQPCAIEQWPDVRTRVLAGRDDRFFPLEFQRRTARDRLGLGTDVIGGGHLVGLSNPTGLAARLDEYRAA